jgi:hypothetical protein
MNSCQWRMGVPNVRQLASLELVEASAPFGLVEASCTSLAPAHGNKERDEEGQREQVGGGPPSWCVRKCKHRPAVC